MNWSRKTSPKDDRLDTMDCSLVRAPVPYTGDPACEIFVVVTDMFQTFNVFVVLELGSPTLANSAWQRECAPRALEVGVMRRPQNRQRLGASKAIDGLSVPRTRRVGSHRGRLYGWHSWSQFCETTSRAERLPRLTSIRSAFSGEKFL